MLVLIFWSQGYSSCFANSYHNIGHLFRHQPGSFLWPSDSHLPWYISKSIMTTSEIKAKKHILQTTFKDIEKTRLLQFVEVECWILFFSSLVFQRTTYHNNVSLKNFRIWSVQRPFHSEETINHLCMVHILLHEHIFSVFSLPPSSLDTNSLQIQESSLRYSQWFKQLSLLSCHSQWILIECEL